MTVASFGSETPTEAMPAPEAVTVRRTSEPDEGIWVPTPGSEESMTKTAVAPAGIEDTATVKSVFPANGGSIAMAFGTDPPLPARPVPEIVGTLVDSVKSLGRSNGGSS